MRIYRMRIIAASNYEKGIRFIRHKNIDFVLIDSKTYRSFIKAWTYYKWTLIVTLMNSCTCLCQKYHNDILNMPPRFDVMIVTVTFPG